MVYLTVPGCNVLSQFFFFSRVLLFESVQHYKGFLYGSTWPRLIGSPVSSYEPEDFYIMGKKCKCLGDGASQYANVLEREYFEPGQRHNISSFTLNYLI